jgi:O-methyltransferase
MDTKELYLDLMKRCLTNSIYGYAEFAPVAPDSKVKKLVVEALNKRGMQVVRPSPFDAEKREMGKDWPPFAHTMIGFKRLNNIQQCIEEVIQNDVPGDLIETGVWRGGAAIFMRAVLKVCDVTDRKVWIADSFEGLPPPDPEKYPSDVGDLHSTWSELAVSLEQVKENFNRYGLFDDQIGILKGWFRDTLPSAPIEQLSVMRLDGDMYESTMDALVNLYPKLSVGGYAIIDDYGYIESCRQAVHDYRNEHSIDEEIMPIDNDGVYWRRSR